MMTNTCSECGLKEAPYLDAAGDERREVGEAALNELRALVEYIDNLPNNLATLLGVNMIMHDYAMNNARSVLQRARQLQGSE